jgi:hypothetical protein
MLLWTIHDFLGYGTVGGFAHQGFVGCPWYGDDLGAEHSKELGKQTYGGCRRWLPMDHVFRRDEMKDHFNGQIERRGVPNREEGVATTSLCRRPIEVRQRIRSMESCRA